MLSDHKEADIKSAIEKLDREQLDLLTKYIYRALETGENASTPLFRWHKAIVEKEGTGPIVRALVDRKTL